MNSFSVKTFIFSGLAVLLMAVTGMVEQLKEKVGVGVKPIDGAYFLFDGSEAMLQKKWQYWKGPGFAASETIQWKIVDDPVDDGLVLSSNDPASAGGKYGAADLVTRDEFKDFRLHIEFLIADAGGNSGVYLQNRYEIQILDGDSTDHGMAAVINEAKAPYFPYRGLSRWNAYDILFRAARFKNGIRVEQPLVTIYFNGKKVHNNREISKVWGGAKSGIDGGNDEGRGVTDTPGGIKLQAEGHDVLYRNIWIKPLSVENPDTDF